MIVDWEGGTPIPRHPVWGRVKVTHPYRAAGFWSQINGRPIFIPDCEDPVLYIWNNERDTWDTYDMVPCSPEEIDVEVFLMETLL